MIANSDLVIVGGSARAAAMSALRAGLRPWCADFFADADLARLCPVLRLRRNDVTEVVDLARQAPVAPWMYSGGMENRPGVVELISQTRPLWGNPAEVLRRVRSPLALADALARRRIPHPEVK